MKVFFVGPPGTGKTSLAYISASLLTGDSTEAIRANKALNVEAINGADVSVDKVREWQSTWQVQTLWGDWRAIVIDEIDKVPSQAKVLMLTFLDRIPSKRGVFATSNIELDENLDAKRTQGRFQLFQIKPPTQEEIIGLVAEKFALARSVVQPLVTQLDVRAALEDAQSYVDMTT